MKCHYEVLGVPRDVNNEYLRKAYRKLALKWHPDKNLDNIEEAREQFQIVQQAYEVLSDSRERAWYDKHRDAILRGGFGNDYEDDSLDVFPYFTSSCFKGYGDDDKGFYAVYREVFNKLGTEDAEFVSNGDSDFEVPEFGFSNSSYEEVVHPFYAYWQSYSTRKSYAWLDPHDIRQALNRRVLRIVERENKKVREKARKERNEEVRNLVAFVRKRDKRVQAHAKLLEERAAENAKKAEEKRRQQLKERQEALQDYKESEWSKFSNIEHELKLIEADLTAEFGESENASETEADTEDELDEAASNSLYCVACNKVFKTEKAFANHENSKRHKENVFFLKEQFKGEEEVYKPKEDGLVCSDSSKPNSDVNISGSELDSENELEIMHKSKKKNKQKKANRTNLFLDSDGTDSQADLLAGQTKKQRKRERQISRLQQNGDPVGESKLGDGLLESSVLESDSLKTTQDGYLSSDDESDCLSKKSRGKKIQKQKPLPVNGTVDSTSKTENESSDKVKLKGKKCKEPRRKTKKDGLNVDTNSCCLTCHLAFPSKNALFDHLKKSGHSVYIPKANYNVNQSDKVKGRSRKTK